MSAPPLRTTRACLLMQQEGFLPRYTAALAAAGASPHQPASQPKEGATSQGGAGEAAGPSPQAEEAAEAVPGYNRPSILDYARAYRMGEWWCKKAMLLQAGWQLTLTAQDPCG
jgi:hypothetical protein